MVLFHVKHTLSPLAPEGFLLCPWRPGALIRAHTTMVAALGRGSGECTLNGVPASPEMFHVEHGRPVDPSGRTRTLPPVTWRRLGCPPVRWLRLVTRGSHGPAIR